MSDNQVDNQTYRLVYVKCDTCGSTVLPREKKGYYGHPGTVLVCPNCGAIL